MNMERLHAFVSGRVQGVCFRDFTQRWASRFGLTGWVRNLDDGRVELTAEGKRDNIEELLGKINEGPSMSRVEGVDVEWGAWLGEFRDFRITW